MPPVQLFEKTVTFTSDITGILIGKGRRNIIDLKTRHPMVKITSGQEDRYPCFHLSSVSLDAVNKCKAELEREIVAATAKVERRQEKRRIERERQKAKSKAIAERQMRENITRELEEKKNRKAHTRDISTEKIESKVRTTNPFGALLDDDSTDEAD